ncbi:MAG TPA: DUF1800 domain-containing protein [Pyrinomonadaceae bacterium]|nr:DUF1800 domain-containing protein [Pyrinomonadaceae bacterium]
MFEISKISHKIFAILLISGMLLPAAALASPPPVKKTLTEEQKIIHVLNRLGFGARPGDVARVKAIGLQKYIDQQLDPAKIDDAVAENKVKDLEIFNMSTAEVFAKYPNPGALLRQLDGGKAKAAVAQNQSNTPPAEVDAKAAADAADAEKRDRQQRLRDLYRQYDLRPANQLVPQIVQNRFLRAVYSERQLQEVMVDFWQNHFNVFSGKAAVRWYIPSYERDVLRKYALGNFKDLLVATAQHPAMLFYLDNFQSVSPNAQAKGKNNAAIQRMAQNGNVPPRVRNRMKQRLGLNDAQIDQRLKQMSDDPKKAAPKRQRGINENYARELMELHTLGVDGGYTQKDIVEVAKAFTGWTIADPSGYRKAAASDIKGNDDKRLARIQRQAGVPDDIQSGEFYFNDRWHEDGVKTVLGHKIDEGGVKDGLKVIDILVNSPATANFIARKLAVKFVSDNPSDALVARVASAFTRSHGDIKTTLRTLFADKEFFAPENYRAKIKTPFELAVSSIRTLGGDTNASPAMIAMLNKLGEVPYGYQAPTGYPDTAEDWVNTGALLERLNFVIAVASNQIRGTHVDLTTFDSKDKVKILDRAIDEVLDGEVSPATRATLLKQIEAPLPEVKPASETEAADVEMPAAGNGKGNRRVRPLLAPSGDPEVFKVISLVLGTPEFQRQ